ncbi:response regulator [Dysgonomonas massiliensis]|uniref:response regulator n=1 Tax=Dysgonomonas massiliensis TaxID=2040292 RepID=UPI000C787862|nr:response regulator [Dysgonomonas massiliensis]
MNKKTCLIIDDEDQRGVFKTGIQDVLKRDGYHVDLIFIHTVCQEVLDENQDIDKEKLTNYIKSEIDGKPIDIIVTDFNLSDKNINGLDVIEIIREDRIKTPIVLYSGNREEVIKSTVFNGEDLKPSDELIRSVKRLMLHNISEFTDRTTYTEEVNKLLKKKENSTQQVLLRKLREFSKEEFKICYPELGGKKFEDIASEIEKDSLQGQKFQAELIEQVLSYMLDINKN